MNATTEKSYMTIRDAGRQSGQLIAHSSWWAMRHLVRAWKWTLAPVVNEWNGLSLNRFIAVLFALTAVHGRLIHDTGITNQDVMLGVLAGALAWGKDVFLLFLEHKDGKP